MRIPQSLSFSIFVSVSVSPFSELGRIHTLGCEEDYLQMLLQFVGTPLVPDMSEQL